MTQLPQRREINSLEEMTDFLGEMQSQASASIQETINAQMMVIKYVQSPALIDTTFDSLIFSLKKSLKAAPNKDIAERVQGQFSIMVQNYIFFLDARLQYTINQHKEEGQELLCKAGSMLAECVVKVAQLSIEGGNPVRAAELATVTINNVFAPTEEGGKSFFEKALNWFLKDSDLLVKNIEFYKMLNGVFEKMSRYQKLIGRSILISEMVRRYTPEVIAHSDNNQSLISIYAQETVAKKQSNDHTVSMIISGVGVVLGLIVYIISLIGAASSKAASAVTSTIATKVFNAAEEVVVEDEKSIVPWAIYLGIVIAICIIYEVAKWLKCRKIVKTCNQEADRLEAELDVHTESLNKIAVQFEDFDDSFMELLS